MAMRKRRWTPGACLCVVCGDLVPEGKQVCPICEDAVQQLDFEELTVQSREEDEAHDR